MRQHGEEGSDLLEPSACRSCCRWLYLKPNDLVNMELPVYIFFLCCVMKIRVFYAYLHSISGKEPSGLEAALEATA